MSLTTEMVISTKLAGLIDNWVSSFISLNKLPALILKQAKKEGISKEQIREIVEDKLRAQGLSDRTIRRKIPRELRHNDYPTVRKPVVSSSTANAKSYTTENWPKMTNSKLETETEVTNPTSNRGPDQTQPNIQSKPKSQPEQQPLQIDWSDENTIENLINDITANKYTDSDCRQILTELLPKILQKGSYRSNIYRINYYKNYFDVIFNYLQIVKYKNKICDGGTYGTLCYNKGKYPYAKDEQGRQIWLCGTHRNAIIKLNKKLAPMTAELFK